MESLTRRNLMVSGLAGTAAVATATLPAIASPTSSDAKLLQLCRNWHRLERAYTRAVLAKDDAEQAQGPVPPVPEILQRGFQVWPGTDVGAAQPGQYSMNGYDWRHKWLNRGELTSIAEGKMYVEARYVPGNLPDDESLVSVPEASRAYANKCLAAHAQWAAARKARTAEADRWNAICDRICSKQEEFAEAIAELPANTMQGLNAKLTIVLAGLIYAHEYGIAQSALKDTRRIDTAARLSPPVAA